jgi:hypothetical protein
MSRTWPRLDSRDNIFYDGLLKNATLFILKNAKIRKNVSKNLYKNKITLFSFKSFNYRYLSTLLLYLIIIKD